MRKKIVAGNWKMNGDYKSSIALYNDIVSGLSDSSENVEVMLAPSFVFLSELLKMNNAAIEVIAQNCADNESGAFTGEVSASMLKSIGIKSVIVGHSERRHIYGESIRDVSEKVIQLLSNDMTVVFCIGEQLSDRNEGNHFKLVSNQLASILSLEPRMFEKVIVAYEPVWAIGTGETASPEQAQEMHAFIRKELENVYGQLAMQTRILYGGSVKASNAVELFSKEDVDGGLVGGAALNAGEFSAIIKAAQ